MLTIRVDNLRQHTVYVHESGELSLGRQPSSSGPSVVIDDDYVSRRQMRVLEMSPTAVKFENLGGNPLHTAEGKRIGLGEVVIAKLPASLHIGHTKIRLEWTQPKHDIMQDTVPALPQLRLGTTLLEPPGAAETQPLASLGDTPTAEKLTYWFETLLTVQHAAVGSTKFYRETTDAIVNLVGLDRGLVALKEGEEWNVVAGSAANDAKTMEYSTSILEKVISSKQTVYGNPREMAARDSLALLEAVVGAPIFDSEHEVVGMLYGSRDLTEGLPHYSITPLEAHVVQLLACSITAGRNREQMERRLDQSEQLAAVGQALGFILHDLRGPLGNARQLVEMLRTNEPSALSRDEQLDYIEESISVASELLNDSLEFCRGRIQVQLVRGSFNDLFAKHLRLLRLSLEEKAVDLQIQVPPTLELTVDPDRMARVIRNLVKNAAEALDGHAGAIITLGAAAQGDKTQLWVADNGPGLPAEVRQRLFRPFSTHGKQGGTGFGLAIAQQLVVAHQGTIEVESSSQGTRFLMTLPNHLDAPAFHPPRQARRSPAVARTDAGQATGTRVWGSAPRRQSSRGGLHILLAEDMLLNQRLVKSLLERLGHTVAIAVDGQEAVDIWRTQSFDVILMDIEMPRLDGFGACQAIRKAEQGTQHIPIYGLSGHETPEALKRCQDAGMDGYLPKPVRLEVLKEVLSDVPVQ